MAIAPETVTLLNAAVRAADNKGATEFSALDVSERFPFADAFLIVTGEVERNVQAISDAIEEELNQAGTRTIRREGREGGLWIILDFGDLMVHVFEREERDFYEIERLWRDCPTIELDLESTGLQGQA